MLYIYIYISAFVQFLSELSQSIHNYSTSMEVNRVVSRSPKWVLRPITENMQLSSHKDYSLD